VPEVGGRANGGNSTRVAGLLAGVRATDADQAAFSLVDAHSRDAMNAVMAASLYRTSRPIFEYLGPPPRVRHARSVSGLICSRSAACASVYSVVVMHSPPFLVMAMCSQHASFGSRELPETARN
jgi:hypothetical protein